MADTPITGRSKPANSISGTADSFTLSTPVRQVSVVNTHATQILYVKPFYGATAAAAAAAAQAGLAGVTATGDVIAVRAIPAGNARKTVVKVGAGRPRYVSLGVLGSGASTTFDIEGTDFYD